MNKRKAVIGYVTYSLVRRIIRRQVRRRISGLVGSGERSTVRRKLPLVGAVAALAAAAAVVLTRHRTVDG